MGPGHVKQDRLTYHHGDLRAALLDAVAALIRERGPANVSLREAARRAGVSHGAPAHHFRGKAGLLTAFATQGYERLGQTILETIVEAGPEDGPGVLEAGGRGDVRFALANPERFEVMFRLDLLEGQDPAFGPAGRAAYPRGGGWALPLWGAAAGWLAGGGAPRPAGGAAPRRPPLH